MTETLDYELDISILQKPLRHLPKIGPKTEEALARLGLHTIRELLLHLPSNVKSKIMMPDLRKVQSGDHVIVKGKVELIDSKPSKYNRRKPFKIHFYNETGFFSLIYFNFYPNYTLRDLAIGDTRIIAGKAENFGNSIQIAHPEFVLPENRLAEIPLHEVIYPLTYGITSKQIVNYVSHAMKMVSNLPEWIDEELLNKYGWNDFKSSLLAAHNPQNTEDVFPDTKTRSRLAFDELLANQLAICLLRYFKSKHSGRPMEFKGELSNKLLQILGFELTEGQKKAIDEISFDQQSKFRMARLLQGDVGSGKTLVALCSMLNVLESGQFQAALMVPTDVLANQHFKTISKPLERLGIKVGLLTGKITGKKRTALLESLENGETQILVGTHALIQDHVKFRDLALIIIDEQHRFGVEQRMRLMEKGSQADLLVMTATPIPRTLTMALYGDMDVTRIFDKPKGRLTINTSTISMGKITEVSNSLDKLIGKGEKIYWICPLVEEKEETEALKLTAAITRFKGLEKQYPGKVALVHGQMKAKEKEESIKAFAEGSAKILVATTVIEVGIDVPDATVIIIEQSERFGLSQLHQLRGRVGRGSKQSHCILLYSHEIGEIARSRLKILKSTNDGFVLSEKDLKLRGGGDLMGTKQSGLPDFKIADFFIHQELLSKANKCAKNIVSSDPYLKHEKGGALRLLLKIFNYSSKELL